VEVHHDCMPQFPQTQTKTRSPRVRIPNKASIRFNLGEHSVLAVLHRLSLTGGLAEFNGRLDDVTIAEAKLKTQSGIVSGLVEFLRPQKSHGPAARAFRFLALGDADYKRLHTTLQLMRQKGYAEEAR
jgi:hypothetical protein